MRHFSQSFARLLRRSSIAYRINVQHRDANYRYRSNSEGDIIAKVSRIFRESVVDRSNEVILGCRNVWNSAAVISPDNRMPAIFGIRAWNHDRNVFGSCRYVCKFVETG